MPSMHDYRHIFKKVGSDMVSFEASDQDTANAIGKVDAGHTFQFYGFESSDGAWIIMQFDTTDATEVLEYRYASGQTHAGYLAAWAGRDVLTYYYFSEITTL